jgi:hypothetical protein
LHVQIPILPPVKIPKVCWQLEKGNQNLLLLDMTDFLYNGTKPIHND